MLLMRNGALLLAALCLAACSSGNPRYNGDKAHHRPTGFVNSDPTANIGNIPLHEVLLRRLRGDFKPQREPEGGYAAFTRAWTLPIDRARLAQPDARAGRLLELDRRAHRLARWHFVRHRAPIDRAFGRIGHGA